MLSAPQGHQTDASTVYAVPSWPHKWIIDVDGIIQDDQTALNKQLVADLLQAVKPDKRKYEPLPEGPPKGDYSKKFDAALKALKAGDFKAAAGELSKLEKEPGADGENAKVLEKWSDEQAAAKIADGDAALAAEDFLAARDAWADVEKRWPSTSDAVKSAKEKEAALKKDKDSDSAKVLAQEKSWKDAQAAEAKGDKAKAISLYQKCADATPGTKFCQRCKDKVKQLSK